VRFDEWGLRAWKPDYDSDSINAFFPEIDRALAQRREVPLPFVTSFMRRASRKV
jgi:hypothetical protein